MERKNLSKNTLDNVQKEVKAMWDYVNRDVYNLKIVKVMLEEIYGIVQATINNYKNQLQNEYTAAENDPTSEPQNEK